MSEGVEKRVRLAAYGFDARSQESFRLAFKQQGKGKAILVDSGAIDGGIINFDSVDAKKHLGDYRQQFPNRPVIVLGVKDPNLDNTLYVKKPASIDDMIHAVDAFLESIAQDIKADEVSAKKVDESSDALQDEQSSEIVSEIIQDIKNSVKESSEKKSNSEEDKKRAAMFYSPKDYLQGEIHSAAEYSNKYNVAVEIWVMTGSDDWKKIIFLPKLNKVLTSLSDKELRQYCSAPLLLMNHKMYYKQEKETVELEKRVKQENRGVAYDAFLWRVALYTSMGRLPQGTDLSAAMYLKHWPNFTRLYPVMGAMRIATLLTDQPRPLPLVAKVLKLPLSQVFTFYSAACAVGIICSTTANQVELAKSSIPKRHKDHTILGRILKRLRTGDSDVKTYA